MWGGWDSNPRPTDYEIVRYSALFVHRRPPVLVTRRPNSTDVRSRPLPSVGLAATLAATSGQTNHVIRTLLWIVHECPPGFAESADLGSDVCACSLASVAVRGLGCHVGCHRDPGWCRTMPVEWLVSGVLGGSDMLAG